MARPYSDPRYLIEKIGSMPEPIRVDGVGISGKEFKAKALSSMEGVSGEKVVMTVTGNPMQIPEVLGLMMGGASLLTIPGFYTWPMTDSLSASFSLADTPAGSVASVSSGTSGYPRINVTTPYFGDARGVDEMSEWGNERFCSMYEGRAFMTAPLQTTILSYIAALGLGIPLSMTTERIGPDSLSKHLSVDDRSIMTKGTMAVKLNKSGFRHGMDCFLSASAPLGPDSVDAAREVFDSPDIVDVYSCTEAGILGARRGDEPFFLMSPMVSSVRSRLHSTDVVGSISKSGDLEFKSFVDTGDRVVTDGRLIELIGRGKAKVSGFSVYPAEVRQALNGSGFMVESVYVEDGVLVCTHRGEFDEPRATKILEDRGLPFYSIPKRYVSVV
jgi:hypothetical protein